MSIQWFPGHMQKAQLQIEKTLPKIDLVIEVLDARIPFSSGNPLLASLRGNKPCLKVLSKSDLADPAMTAQWQAYFESQTGIRARAVTTSQGGTIARLAEACHKLVPERQAIQKPLRTMIMGVPNVGKSTLINILAGRSIAKTGNEPAVTKNQQEIQIGKGIVLLDTPGVLWPNLDNANSSYRLAATGAIKDTAIEYADIAVFVGKYLLEKYPETLVDRYSLDVVPADPVALLDAIGKRRGCLARGGIVDYERASRIFINDLRAGALGPISFESPELVEQETSMLQETQVKEAVKKKTDKAKRKAAFKKRQKR